MKPIGRNALLAITLLAITLSFSLGCGGSTSPSDPPSGAEAQVAEEGEALYRKYCALCHGEQLEGYAADHANALANQNFLRSASDGFIATAIRRGRPGTPMAAYDESFGGPLGSQEVAILTAFIRSHQSEPPVALEKTVEGDPAVGKAIYQKRCIGCHGREGEGNTALSLNNPLFLSTVTDGYIRFAIEYGREGTKMPAYGERMSTEELNGVTRYVRSFINTVSTARPEGEVPPAFDQVVINPDGPAPDFSPLREGRYVPAEEVKKALEKGARMVILDARPTSDWLRSHIPGALPVPYYDPARMVDSIPRDGTWVLAYCACPHAASGRVMDTLRDRGFEKTAVIDEGVIEWAQRGYPMTYGRQ